MIFALGPCGFHAPKIHTGVWNFNTTVWISAELGIQVVLIIFFFILPDMAPRSKKALGKHPLEPSLEHLEFVIPKHQARF